MRSAVGDAAMLRVYPNFAAVSRYAWLAGDRRLAEIGIKSYPMRGSGTDFKQLADYRPGDPIRDIDWKATLRHGRPIVREYQDERDQSVVFLLDCGRRMRADEGSAGAGGSHFDAALDALMLLAYVALKEGDAVGAMTFGGARGIEPAGRAAQGRARSNALIATLYDVEPQRHAPRLPGRRDDADGPRSRKRSLVVVLTNFRDEDARRARGRRCRCCARATWCCSRACASGCCARSPSSRWRRRPRRDRGRGRAPVRPGARRRLPPPRGARRADCSTSSRSSSRWRWSTATARSSAPASL